jgi:NADP-dependent 3-hydroxy acid dehydrogenase YdfG
MAVARALAAEGCDLVLAGRKLPTLEKAGRELTQLGSRVLAKLCDVLIQSPSKLSRPAQKSNSVAWTS